MAGRKDAPFRLFNLRYVPLFAAFLILGIFSVSLSYLAAALLMAVALLCLVALVFTRSLTRGVAVVLALTLVVGYLSAFTALHVRNEVGAEGYYTVNCRVVSVREEDGVYFAEADGLRIGGKLYAGGVTLKTDKPLAEGDRVTAIGTISIRKLSLAGTFDALQYRKGKKYVMTADVCDVAPGRPALAARIRGKIREMLLRYQGDRAGAFSCAMLFGDTSYMADEDLDAMRSVGVAHVFAVSGLHVGVLSAAILLLLKKLKAKRYVPFLVMIPILGFYAYLAGFTPSVLRASVMILLYLTASLLGMRYDDLSALSFAAVLILIVRPLYLFDVSFLLSFLALFGIVSLASPLEKCFNRRKIPPFLASALALSVSTSVAILPVSATIFGKVSLLGVLLNVVVVPLASLTYLLTVILLPFALLYSGFGGVLGALRFLPLAMIEIGEWGASVNVTGEHSFAAWEFVLYYATLLFVGKYSLARPKVKLVAGAVVFATFGILLFAL